jgi:hypothetical protein
MSQGMVMRPTNWPRENIDKVPDRQGCWKMVEGMEARDDWCWEGKGEGRQTGYGMVRYQSTRGQGETRGGR